MQKSGQQVLLEVIMWTVAAAKEHVELSRFRGEDPDPEVGMGLWQSFQAMFPKQEGIAFPSSTRVDHDLAVALFSETYKRAVEALVSFRPDGGRSRFEEPDESEETTLVMNRKVVSDS